MRIIVSDSSCLIDLQKGGLIEAFLKLPYELVVPDVLLEDELLSFSKKEISVLRANMTVATLEAEGVERAARLLQQFPYLSANDGFALVVAEERKGCILLTGDRRLRALAEKEAIEVHGSLWAAEEMFRNRVVARLALVVALEAWKEDESVRVPHVELGRLIARLKRTK